MDSFGVDAGRAGGGWYHAIGGTERNLQDVK
jgi:hypothetical protein